MRNYFVTNHFVFWNPARCELTIGLLWGREKNWFGIFDERRTLELIGNFKGIQRIGYLHGYIQFRNSR